MLLRTLTLGALLSGAALPAAAGQAPATSARPASARPGPAVSNIRYELTFDTTTSGSRTIKVAMQFDVAGTGPVILSLPAWTPGSYEISNFVRRVSEFSATSGGKPIGWRKADHDSWRVMADRPGTVEIRFDLRADTLDNGMAWSRRDFALVNGTNVFPYPEDGGFDFRSRVTLYRAGKPYRERRRRAVG